MPHSHASPSTCLEWNANNVVTCMACARHTGVALVAGEQMMYSTGASGDDVLFTYHSSRSCQEAILKATNYRIILVTKVSAPRHATPRKAITALTHPSFPLRQNERA